MKRSLLTLILLLLTCGIAAGATLENYKDRLDKAAGYLADLDKVLPNVSPAYQLQMADLVERTIPPTEKVDWPGGEVETKNAWLTAAMDEFRSDSDPDKRRAILREARQRLEAASTAIDDLWRGTAAGQTKDADKQKLGEILTRPEYQPATTQEESLFQRWWREFWEWFDKQFPRPHLDPSSSVGLGSLRTILQVVIFVVIAGVIGLILWKFLPYFSARFGRRDKRGHGDRVILGELVSADESSADILSEAERLAREGDIRGAIRKGYIALLCELGDRRLVRLARHKTNRDYLRDLRRTPSVHDGLNSLTSSFEQNWYGLRTARPEDWEAFRSGYEATIKEAKMRS